MQKSLWDGIGFPESEFSYELRSNSKSLVLHILSFVYFLLLCLRFHMHSWRMYNVASVLHCVVQEVHGCSPCSPHLPHLSSSCPLAHKAPMQSFHLVLSLATVLAVPHPFHPKLFLSDSTVLLQVVFGLPTRLSPLVSMSRLSHISCWFPFLIDVQSMSISFSWWLHSSCLHLFFDGGLHSIFYGANVSSRSFSGSCFERSQVSFCHPRSSSMCHTHRLTLRWLLC